MSGKIFKIAGMDCAEETNALRRAVGALSGIRNVEFNLLNGTMTVMAVEGAVDNRDVIAGGEELSQKIAALSPPDLREGWESIRAAQLDNFERDERLFEIGEVEEE